MIRKDIRNGRVRQVMRQLGHAYQITGKVVRGRQLGRTIGFPTINVNYGRQLLPGNGVYSALVGHDGRLYPAMANVGNNPTVSDGSRRTLEAHIFDFSEDLYGQLVTVNFIDFIRRDRKFDSVKELTEQLKKDSEAARQTLSQYKQPHNAKGSES
ncbi:MAG: hypothetical protein IKX74_01695 [Erysipelotrichaceae bacterium]|nr:hypothetical protein [Erysipelotrichaceae bacterium]MBR5048351.1 hypothetical protein [Erysipelotrichaceae bacterium]